MQKSTGSENLGRWRSPRALSTVTAAIIMIVVIIVVGAGAYFALGGSIGNKNTTSSTSTTCQPANSPGCAGFVSGGHTLSLLAPFKSAQTGQSVPFTILLSSGTASSFGINFGDGTKSYNGTSPDAQHVYSSPGTYLVEAFATIGGKSYDSLQHLVQVSISASYSSLTAGNSPNIGGQILSNSSTNVSASGVLQSGNSLTVAGTYLALPTNPNFVANAPTLQVIVPSGGSATKGTPTTTNTSVTGTVKFTAPGTYVVSAIGNATGNGPDNGQTATQMYNWTVIVAASGSNGGLAGAGGGAKSPHPGTVIYYSTAQGGAQSLDPSIAYDTVSYEPIISVYEGLIMYNGSTTGPDPSDYLPVLSTCVPGPNSASCSHLYGGNTLYNSTTQAYTFPIVKDAKFYDPTTKASWSVYPSDVAFSLFRTASFADKPASGAHNGWIVSQAILPGPQSPSMAANPNWDSGIHYPYNNTAQAFFSNVLVNDSAYCPSSIMSSTNGCVTFLANGNGHPWPYFLELIADQLGSSVMSCAWTSSSAASGGQAAVPGWAATSGSSDAGDHPCLLPGGAMSTSDSSFTTWLGTTLQSSNLAALDSWQLAGSGTSNGGGSVGNVIHAMVGSGPYYLEAYSPSLSYELGQNPGYAPNAACTWTNCMPPVGHFAKTVEVTWESNIAQGEQALASGVADTAGVPATDFPLLLQLIQQGKAQALSFPSLSIYFYPYNFDFQLSGASHFSSNAITVPSDFFSYVGMRQFFTTSYAYSTVASTILTSNGIQTAFNYGGAIPQFMANYYPTNISWPSQDPSQACSGSGANTPLCPTYWWTQMTTPSSPYYDPEATACSTTSPCQVPLVGQTGAPPLDEQNNLWVQQLSAFSGGKLKVTYQDINFLNLVINSLFSAPYQNPMPVYTLGWAPDYPDPTDYMVPLYLPDSTYTASDAVAEQMSAHFNGSGCSQTAGAYIGSNPVNQTCQGAAFYQMNKMIAAAAVMPAGPARVLEYNLVEQIANKLALYTYQYQANEVVTLAPWDNPTTVNTNVTIGGGGDFVWWSLGGNGVWG